LSPAMPPFDKAADRSTYDVGLRTAIDPAWEKINSIPLGSHSKVPVLFMHVKKLGAPYLRVELFDHVNDSPRAFKIWGNYLAVGFGFSFCLVNLETLEVKTYPLKSYFSDLLPGEGYLLVADGSSLIKINQERDIEWQTILGLDGVQIDRVGSNIAYGEGQWDPPEGWEPFQVDLATGKSLIQITKDLFSNFEGYSIRRGGTFYLKLSKANEFIDLCLKKKLFILGIEGFLTDGSSEILPIMDAIFDMSGLDKETGTRVKRSAEEAKKFIAGLKKGPNVYLEFVLKQ
jgi:hypothetical protein